MTNPMMLSEEADVTAAYLAWAHELRAIEARNFSKFGDWTRAAILRSCMRAVAGGC